MCLNNKNVVLCITGGIAAYKAVALASLLVKNNANVFPVLTKNALKFITPLTLKTITKNKVTYKMFDTSDFIPHISLAELADIVVVAPATANIIAKIANGIADDMVSTLILSTKATKIIIPAMNCNMYLNPITQENIKKLLKNDFLIMQPDTGNLACGTEGIGRFPEVDKIFEFISESIQNKKVENNFFKDKKVLITLGGTIEDIDPVRYISNRSSGRMGFSFAEAFDKCGAFVTIISGNVDERLLDDFKNKYKHIKIINIRSASNMKDEVIKFENDFDVYLMSAAVADYTVDFSDTKIKKNEEEIILKLKRTQDILKSLKKRDNAIYIGFAAETDDLLESARKKLKEKNLTFLIANNVKGDKSAIGSESAKIFLLNKWNDKINEFDYMDKKQLARKTVIEIEKIISANKNY
jgi:phosphopantothenoylcysteine decarboxylase/phosphopantothenate--cysteine ligase